MGNVITWRNIDAPNMGDPSRTLTSAGNSFRDMFSGLQTELGNLQVNEEANWQQNKENNTNAFLARLAEFQTPEEAQAAMASGELRGMLEGFGAQVDQRLAADRKGSLIQNLQERAMAAQQFEQGQQAHKDWLEELGQRDVLNGLNEALLRAQTPEEVANLKQAISIYQASGMLNSRGSNALMGDALARRANLVSEGREEQKHNWLVAQNAHAELLRPGELDLQQAKLEAERAQAAAARVQAQAGRNPQARPMSIPDTLRLAEYISQPHRDENNNNVFGGPVWNSTEGQKSLNQILNTTGVRGRNGQAPVFAQNVVNTLVQSGDVTPDRRHLIVRRGGAQTTVPLTAALLERAITEQSSQHWFRHPSESDVAARLTNIVRSDAMLQEAQTFAYNRFAKEEIRRRVTSGQ